MNANLRTVGLWTLAIGPALGLLLTLFAGTWRDIEARQRVIAEIRARKIIDLPPSIRKLVEEQNSPTISEARRQIADLTVMVTALLGQAGHVNSINRVGSSLLSELAMVSVEINPASDYSNVISEAKLARKLAKFERVAKQAKPLIAELNRWKTEAPEKLTEGLYVDEIVTLIEVDFVDAFYRSDHERAMSDIRLIADWATKIDPAFDYYRTNRLTHVYVLVADTLRFDFWTADQLVALVKMLDSPIDMRILNDRLRTTDRRAPATHFQQYYFQTDTSEEAIPYFSFSGLMVDSVYADDMLRSVEDEAKITAFDTGIIADQAIQLEKKQSAPDLNRNPGGPTFPVSPIISRVNHSQQLPIKMFEAAMSRQWYRNLVVAMGLKRYWLLQKKWPTEIAELREFGFTEDQLKDIHGEPMRIDIASGAEQAREFPISLFMVGSEQQYPDLRVNYLTGGWYWISSFRNAIPPPIQVSQMPLKRVAE